jgi:uncharacterized membrane protein
MDQRLSLFQFFIRLPFWIISRILYCLVWSLILFIPCFILFSCVGAIPDGDAGVSMVFTWPITFYLIVAISRTVWYIIEFLSTYINYPTLRQQTLRKYGDKVLNSWTWRFSDRAPTYRNWFTLNKNTVRRY